MLGLRQVGKHTPYQLSSRPTVVLDLLPAFALVPVDGTPRFEPSRMWELIHIRPPLWRTRRAASGPVVAAIDQERLICLDRPWAKIRRYRPTMTIGNFPPQPLGRIFSVSRSHSDHDSGKPPGSALCAMRSSSVPQCFHPELASAGQFHSHVRAWYKRTSGLAELRLGVRRRAAGHRPCANGRFFALWSA